MEHNNHNQTNNSGGNGFLLGVIVGVLLTLLFTTKRGRAIFKEILEKGVEKFSNLEELMKMSVDEDGDDEFEEDDDYIPAEPVQTVEPTPEEKENVKDREETPPPSEKEPTKPIKTAKQEAVPTQPPIPEAKTPSQIEKAPEKPKTASGKRWFRGLRKKS